jgi:Fur family ferric uptake transcriptional regulator
MIQRGKTKHRQLLLDILKEADGHLGAKEIFKKALEHDFSISLATVYRNLQLFEELGLVNGKRLDKTHCWYELKRSGDHCDVICTACGNIIEFESPTINRLVEEIEGNAHFNVTKAVLYLEGNCKRCKEQMQPKRATGRKKDDAGQT